MRNCYESNFKFVRSVNEELFGYLYNAEKTSRTNFAESARACRAALETFVNALIESNGLWSKCDANNLDNKIDLLLELNILKSEYQGRCFKIEEYYTEGGDIRRNTSCWKFMRWLGNNASHTDMQNYWSKLTYENILLCIKALHSALKVHYNRSNSQFSEDRMQIQDYCIYSSLEPSDKNRSMCEREYMVKRFNGEEVKNFAVLRLYDKRTIKKSDAFLLRNQASFSQAARQSIRNTPEGMVTTEEITPVDDKNTSFYIISYLFYQEPIYLSKLGAVLKEMSPESKTLFCSRIVNCLSQLHTQKQPIYHRMLNYDCVLVCNVNDEWIPYIAKFDYAKLVSPTIKGTIYGDAASAKRLLKEGSLIKYLPPEWQNTGSSTESIDWEKVDIYSAGVLFTDIFAGEFNDILIPTEKLESIGMSSGMSTLIANMRADEPSERWTLKEINEFLIEEI